MKPFRSQSTSEQLTEHLRQEILSGKLSGTMPGIKKLVQTLGVNTDALTKAIKQLEHDGLVVSQGDRRRRKIVQPEDLAPNSLCVGLLIHDPSVALRHDTLLLVNKLTEAGHTVVFATKSMHELQMNVPRIARMVNATDVDSWIVSAGSREVLGWFQKQPKPTFAVFGRWYVGSCAGPIMWLAGLTTGAKPLSRLSLSKEERSGRHRSGDLYLMTSFDTGDRTFYPTIKTLLKN